MRYLFAFFLSLMSTQAFSYMYADYNLSHMDRPQRFAWYDCVSNHLASDSCQALFKTVCEAPTNKFSKFCVDIYFRDCRDRDFEGEFCQKNLSTACNMDPEWSKDCDVHFYEKCQKQQFTGQIIIRNPISNREQTRQCPNIRVQMVSQLFEDTVKEVEKNGIEAIRIGDTTLGDSISAGYRALGNGDKTNPFTIAAEVRDARDAPPVVDPVPQCKGLALQLKAVPNVQTLLSVRLTMKQENLPIECGNIVYNKAVETMASPGAGTWEEMLVLDLYLRDSSGRNGRVLRNSVSRFLAKFGADSHTTIFFLLSGFDQQEKITQYAIIDRLQNMQSKSGIVSLLLYRLLYGNDPILKAHAMSAFASRWRIEFDANYVADVGTELKEILLPCVSSLTKADVESMQDHPDLHALSQGPLEDQFCKIGLGLDLSSELNSIYDQIYVPAVQGRFGLDAQLAGLSYIAYLTPRDKRSELMGLLDAVLLAAKNTKVRLSILNVFGGLLENDRLINAVDQDLWIFINGGAIDFEYATGLLDKLVKLRSIRPRFKNAGYTFGKGNFFDYLIECQASSRTTQLQKDFCFDAGIAFVNKLGGGVARYDVVFEERFYPRLLQRLSSPSFDERRQILGVVLDKMGYNKGGQHANPEMVKGFAELGLARVQSIFSSHLNIEPFLLREFSRLTRQDPEEEANLDAFLMEGSQRAFVSDVLKRSWSMVRFKNLLDIKPDVVQKDSIRFQLDGKEYVKSFFKLKTNMVFDNWTAPLPWQLDVFIQEGFVKCEPDPNGSTPDGCLRIEEEGRLTDAVVWQKNRREIQELILTRPDFEDFDVAPELLRLFLKQNLLEDKADQFSKWSLSWGLFGNAASGYTFIQPN